MDAVSWAKIPDDRHKIGCYGDQGAPQNLPVPQGGGSLAGGPLGALGAGGGMQGHGGGMPGHGGPGPLGRTMSQGMQQAGMVYVIPDKEHVKCGNAELV